MAHMRIRGYVVAGSTLIGIGVSCLLLAPYCLWVLWHLLPGETETVRLALAAELLPSPVVYAATGLNQNMLSRVAWEQGAHGRTVIALPRMRYQLTAMTELTKAGYTVERRGLLLRGQTGNGGQPIAWPPLTTVLQRMGKSLIISPEPVLPSIIASVETEKVLVVSGTYVVGARYRDTLHSLIRTRKENSPTPEIEAHPPIFDKGLLIETPAEHLRRVPVQAVDIWEKALRAKLGFTLTEPKIMEELLRFDTIGLYLNEKEGGIVSAGAASTFEGIIRSWIEEEERRARPQTRVFRLPDGTLGSEKVPGNPEPVFSPERRNDCYEPLAGKTTLWLCNNGKRIALASNEAVARTLLQEPHEPSGMLVTEPVLQQLQERIGCTQDPQALLCQADRLEVAGNSGRIRVTLTAY